MSARDDRVAQRIAWLNELPPVPASMWDRLEPGQMLGEVDGCFVSGYFMAVVLLATSFLEHVLQEALELRGLVKPGNKLNLEAVIDKVRDAGFPAPDLLDMADKLRMFRNPVTHRKEDGHEHSLTARFHESKKHPHAILEEDAKLAITVMRRIHRATLVSLPEDEN